MDGAYLMDKIRSRSIECGDCLLWQGAGADKTPCMRLPGERSLVSVRRVVLEIAGKWRAGMLATNTCGTAACVGEDHAIGVTRKALVKRAVERTAYHKRPTRNAKISAIARASGRLSPEAVADIRASDLPTRALAERHGVSQSTVWELVSGKTYRDYNPNVFSGLGARR
jgi:hypothetical protein